ncbi:MAG: glutaredoxin-like protein [Thermoplasmatales archaeon I-plasma]|jgi:glutaredoxin-like protein|nr:MAG: glutaredoxin-like protein [Thermoplasmatales archaeon I-plasma]MCL4450511.1 thioredoxin family protein [Candidatus Thermoplasmatota archaeon]MCL5929990.1 thioredoxin family protein [Candidatus Thermoplasmatota archaeon]
MALLKDKDKTYLRDEFKKNLKNEVKLYVFTSEEDCQYCDQTVEIAHELQETSDKIDVEVLGLDSEKAKKWGIDKAPTTVVTSNSGSEHARIKYIGIPMGYEFSSLVEDIRRISRNDPEIEPEVQKKLEEIDKPVTIRVFVTPTCPYCPKAVGTAHKFALANKNITGEMVEATEFPAWADEWGVSSVPHIVINGDVQFVGAYPDENFVDYVLEAYKKQGN